MKIPVQRGSSNDTHQRKRLRKRRRKISLMMNTILTNIQRRVNGKRKRKKTMKRSLNQIVQTNLRRQKILKPGTTGRGQQTDQNEVVQKREKITSLDYPGVPKIKTKGQDQKKETGPNLRIEAAADRDPETGQNEAVPKITDVENPGVLKIGDIKTKGQDQEK